MTAPEPPNPLAVRCPVCEANPRQRCIWRHPNGKPSFREPHAERVLAAQSR